MPDFVHAAYNVLAHTKQGTTVIYKSSDRQAAFREYRTYLTRHRRRELDESVLDITLVYTAEPPDQEDDEDTS